MAKQIALPDGRFTLISDCIMIDYKPIYLGSFPTPEAAARAYDQKAYELAGEFAQGNLS